MVRLHVRLFGPPQIQLNGSALELDHRKPVALLTYLMITSAPHSREALATLFWPEYPNARAYLRNNLFIIRRALGEDYKQWISIERQIVAWQNSADLWLDVAQFEQHLTAYHSHCHKETGLCTTCVEQLTQAVALAKNEFLAGFTLRDCPPFDEWCFFERERLRMETIVALDALAGFHANQGSVQQAIVYARSRLELDNYHEPTHRQLMDLYAQNDQSTLALRQYEVLTNVLRTELASVPSDETNRLVKAIKQRHVPPHSRNGSNANDQSTTIKDMGQTNGHVRPFDNIPAQLTTFVGRAKELSALKAMVADPDVRLITLTGPGGVGKTRLSLAVATEVLSSFRGGICFVALASIRRPDLIPSAIAEALDIRLSSERSVVDALKIALSNKETLLILDNFEHLLPAAPTVTDLLRACPSLRIVVTSREALNLTGEYEFSLSPFPISEFNQSFSDFKIEMSSAVQLFASRAVQTQAKFTLDEKTLPLVAELCRLLDGLPLAIELAAARIKHFSVQKLLSQLSGFSAEFGSQGPLLDILQHKKRDVPQRHHSLRMAIAWSYDLLSNDEQTVFRRLSLFVDSWSTEAVEAVCSDGLVTDIDAILNSLADKHLILSEEDGATNLRFSILETLRAFAAERLHLSGEEDTHGSAMVNFYLDIVERNDWRTNGTASWDARQILRHEHPNIRKAMDIAIQRKDIDTCLRFCIGLHMFWNSYPHEAQQYLEKVLPLIAEHEPTGHIANVIIIAGYYSILASDNAIGLRLLLKGLEMNKNLDQPIAHFFKGMGMGMAAGALFGQGHYRESERRYVEAIAEAKQDDDDFSTALIETDLGNKLTRLGRFDEANTMIEHAWQRVRSSGQTWGVVKVRLDRGYLRIHTGDYVDALKDLTEARRMAEEEQAEELIGGANKYLGLLSLRQQRYRDAAAFFLDGLDRLHSYGGRRWAMEMIGMVAELALHTGRFPEALLLSAATVAQYERSGRKIPPVPKKALNSTIADARERLPDRADGLWSEGTTFSLDNTINIMMQLCRALQ